MRSFEQVLSEVDLPEEAGVAYRVMIPAAIYATVRNQDELAEVLHGLDVFPPMKLLEGEEFETNDVVLYVGWNDEPIGIADIETED